MDVANLSETDKVLLGVIDGPAYPDECGHGGYIATYECVDMINGRLVTRVCDLYCFRQPKSGQSFCIRTGAEASDYHSPGDIENIILWANQGDNLYRGALAILKKIGRTEWVANN